MTHPVLPGPTACGLILFAHGARDPAWAAPFEAVATAVRRERPDAAVRLAYLELMHPSLAEAGDALCAAGCTRIEVLPLFLGTGGHLKRDLPPLLDALRARHADVQWTLHPAVGESALLAQAMCRIALNALNVFNASPPAGDEPPPTRP